MSFPTILRRSLPTWLLLALPVSATAGGSWQAHAPLPPPLQSPTPRHGLGAVSVGGRVYVVAAARSRG